MKRSGPFLHSDAVVIRWTLGTSSCIYSRTGSYSGSTTDGYRLAIADKLGNLRINVSKDESLTRLLDNFRKFTTKSHRGISF